MGDAEAEEVTKTPYEEFVEIMSLPSYEEQLRELKRAAYLHTGLEEGNEEWQDVLRESFRTRTPLMRVTDWHNRVARDSKPGWTLPEEP